MRRRDEEREGRAGGVLPGAGGVRRQPSVFRYPRRERFAWREWTVPFALAAALAAAMLARAALRQPAVELQPPDAVPGWLARPVATGAPATEAAPPPSGELAVTGDIPGVRVVLRSEGTTWVEAAPDGGPTTRHELGPGQELELTARERLGLALGDAGALKLNVNGRELGFVGDKGEFRPGMLFTRPAPAVAAAPADGD